MEGFWRPPRPLPPPRRVVELLLLLLALAGPYIDPLNATTVLLVLSLSFPAHESSQLTARSSQLAAHTTGASEMVIVGSGLVHRHGSVRDV